MIRRSLSSLSAPGTKLRAAEPRRGRRGLRSGALGPCLLVSSPGTAGDEAGSVKSSDRERLRRRSPGRPPEQAQPLATPRRARPPPLLPRKLLLGTRRPRHSSRSFGRRLSSGRAKHQVLSVAVGLLGFLCASGRTHSLGFLGRGLSGGDARRRDKLNHPRCGRPAQETSRCQGRLP